MATPVQVRAAFLGRVTKVDNNDKALKTLLQANSVSMEEIAHTFELDFSQQALTAQGARQLRVRGIDLSPLAARYENGGCRAGPSRPIVDFWPLPPRLWRLEYQVSDNKRLHEVSATIPG